MRRAGEVRDVILAWPGRYREVAENLRVNGETYRLRSETSPEAVAIFQALGYRIPPRIEHLAKGDRNTKTEVSRAQNALV